MFRRQTKFFNTFVFYFDINSRKRTVKKRRLMNFNSYQLSSSYDCRITDLILDKTLCFLPDLFFEFDKNDKFIGCISSEK